METPFLHEWLFRHAERRPDAPAVATPDTRLTYGELAARVRALADQLAASGVRPRDRVLLALPNAPATIVAGLAVNAAGATSVEVSREWSPRVLSEIVARTGSQHAVTFWRDAGTWEKVLATRPLARLWLVHPTPPPQGLPTAIAGAPVTLLRDDGHADPALGAAARAPSPALDPSDPALILYTSGSTGMPRGVVQTFRNVDANTRSIVQYLELGDADRALVVLPLHYCYGRSVLQTHLFAGGSVFLEGRCVFPRVVLESLASERCTGFAGVPLTYELLRRQVDVPSMRFPELRYLTVAGGAMAPDTVGWARRAFHPARLFVMYGQTEATARLTYLPPERAEEKSGSIGIPIPGVELRVVDDAGRDLPAGETGHLLARGESVTPGYFDEPEATAAILSDGWLRTGDLARRDADGFFFHRGRTKEILKVGGHRVSPAEIEQVIALHPELADVAVLGVPHPLLGEAPAALVVPHQGAGPSEDELRRFCRARLPAHHVPVSFSTVEGLPRNEAGKLLRAQLALPVQPVLPARLEPAPPGARLPALDGVRGLAVAMVMLLHFLGWIRAETWPERILASAVGYGKFGPELFFVLSGFLITGILQDSRSRPHYFRNFYVRRVLRIFPLYFAVMAAVLLIAPRLPALRGESLDVLLEQQAWAWTLSINLLTAWRGVWSFPYLDHFWSISVEEHFYLLWPFVVWRLGGRPRVLMRLCLAVIAAVFAARVAMTVSGATYVTMTVLTPLSFDALCLGALLAIYGRQPGGGESLRRWVRPASAVAAVTLVLCFVAGRLSPVGGDALKAVRHELFVALLAAVVLLAAGDPRRSIVPRFFLSPPMLALGKYSYGLYAFHHFFSYYFEKSGVEAALTARLGTHLGAVLLLFVAGVAGSIALSVASYHALERPFLELKRYFAPGGAPTTAR